MEEWTPERIKQLRRQLGYTQSEMAEALGYNRYQTISEFENGNRTPPHDAEVAWRPKGSGRR